MANLSTLLKFGGWNLRAKAIRDFIVGFLLIIAGIVLAIIFKSFNPLILLVLGIIVLFVGWLYWKRSKAPVKGRFY